VLEEPLDILEASMNSDVAVPEDGHAPSQTGTQPATCHAMFGLQRFAIAVLSPI